MVSGIVAFGVLAMSKVCNSCVNLASDAPKSRGITTLQARTGAEPPSVVFILANHHIGGHGRQIAEIAPPDHLIERRADRCLAGTRLHPLVVGATRGEWSRGAKRG